jgi:DNA-binding NarL/FixJ family response regulator
MKIVVGYSVQEAFPGFCEQLSGKTSVETIFPHRGYKSFVEVLTRHRADVVMTTESVIASVVLALPELDDESLPLHKRVLITSGCTPTLLVLAAQTGFDDVLDVNQSIDDVVGHLESLLSGRRSLRSNPVWQTLDYPLDLTKSKIVLADEVDRQIVGLVAAGLSDREIGELVFLSCQTVRNRVSRLLDRCGVRNRTQLALLYTRSEYERVVHHDHAAGSFVCRFGNEFVGAG